MQVVFWAVFRLRWRSDSPVVGLKTLAMVLIDLSGGVGSETNLGCLTLIFTIYDRVRENAAL